MPDPIVVYGATGFTGRLVTAELARRGHGMVLAGRSASKLAAAAEALGSSVIDAVAASLDDPAALRRVAAAGPVLVNVAGPFAITGRPEVVIRR